MQRRDLERWPVLSRAAVRELDRIALEQYGLPGCVLMENAGRGAADVIAIWIREHLLLEMDASRVAIACGPGNNGGDGYVVARHLHNAGAEVELYSTVARESLRGDAAWARAVVDRMGLSVVDVTDGESIARAAIAWSHAHVAVDALLGTGATGTPRGTVAAAMAAFEALRGPYIVALDLPSGLDCDTGGRDGPCVRADLTITFAALKPGLIAPAARPWIGRVVVTPIGAPRELVERLALGSSDR